MTQSKVNMCIWTPTRKKIRENGPKATLKDIQQTFFKNWWKSSSHKVKYLHKQSKHCFYDLANCLSKFESSLSLALSMLWTIFKSSFIVQLFAFIVKLFLWNIFIFFVTTTFLIYVNKFTFTNLCCISRIYQMVSVSTFLWSAISSMTPFILNSNFN